MRLFCWALVLVFICAFPALAQPDQPPKELAAYVQQYQLVHRGRCDFQTLAGVPCLIYVDGGRDIIYLILFSEKLEVTHIAAVKGDEEHIIWCSTTVCI